MPHGVHICVLHYTHCYYGEKNATHFRSIHIFKCTPSIAHRIRRMVGRVLASSVFLPFVCVCVCVPRITNSEIRSSGGKNIIFKRINNVPFNYQPNTNILLRIRAHVPRMRRMSVYECCAPA